MEHSEAIILTQYPYRESSLVLHAYTLEWGMQAFLINGVRKTNAKNKAAFFQPLSRLRLTAYYRPGRDLHRLKEWSVTEANHGIMGHFVKSTIALFMADVLHKVLRSHQSEPELFAFVSSRVQWLNGANEGLALLPIQFVHALCKPLGVEPILGTYSNERRVFDLLDGQFVAAVPEHTAYWSGDDAELFAAGRQAGFLQQLRREQRRRLLELWLQYLRIHHEGMGQLQSHKILSEVFDD